MVSRVKFYTEYRKQIGSKNDLTQVLDYEPKHLITKSEIQDKILDKKVQALNEYEEKRNEIQRLYLRKNIIYYVIVGIISLAILAAVIYFGIRVFD